MHFLLDVGMSRFGLFRPTVKVLYKQNVIPCAVVLLTLTTFWCIEVKLGAVRLHPIALTAPGQNSEIAPKPAQKHTQHPGC